MEAAGAGGTQPGLIFYLDIIPVNRFTHLGTALKIWYSFENRSVGWCFQLTIEASEPCENRVDKKRHGNREYGTVE